MRVMENSPTGRPGGPRAFWAALTAVLLATGGCGAAGTVPSGSRIGVVEFQKVFNETTTGKKNLETLNAFIKNREALIELEEKELKRMQEDFAKQASVLSDSAKREREEQFRREVAAAHEDPDTYAPGKPDSVDPVRQVSISVIGEGLIQLRGPIKGVNECRMMIHQIDTPVGTIITTSDFKIDETPVNDKPADLEKLKRFGDDGCNYCLATQRARNLKGILFLKKQFKKTLNLSLNK